MDDETSFWISGIQEETQDDGESKALAVIEACEPSTSIQAEHIGRCQRVGKPEPGKSRNIIVKFLRYRYRLFI